MCSRVICLSGVVVLRRLAWQAHAGVCAGVIFVGPAVQPACFGELDMRQNWSTSFWRHSPVLVLDACRKRVKVGFRDKRSSLGDSEFVASLLCVAGATLASVVLQFRGRRITLEFFCKFSGAVLSRLGAD